VQRIGEIQPFPAFVFVPQNRTVYFRYNPPMQTELAAPGKRQSGNIFLVGMMGAGKTTVGKLLAQQSGKTFVDSDEEIQRRTGVTIQHIFDIEGEPGFRQRETHAIQTLVGLDNIVLATGGGAVLSEQNREMLRRNGVVVYLKSAVQDLWQRTRYDRSRPLLRTGDPLAKLTELYEQRDPLYTQVADLVIPSGRQGAYGLVQRLRKELKLLSGDAADGS
jgi:shikimate kinase